MAESRHRNGGRIEPERPTRRHAVCTIVAHNYVAQARVLARSLTALHPDIQFFTLIVDGDEDDRSLLGLGAVVLPGDLGIASETLDSMRAIYDVMEYATALKPAMLMHMHRGGAPSATYFDPDIRVFAPLDDIFAMAAATGLVLTPHTLEPLPRDGKKLTESDIMQAGIYNLGFISTGPRGYRFLAWWHDHLVTDAVVDLASALFTDQRWIDWAPAIESPVILRDAGLNAAYWNLHEREIRFEDGRWYAGAVPLRFFHFSGYDPARPWLLSKHMGTVPRTLLSDKDDLRRLCDDYGAELTELGHVTLRQQRYRNDTTPDGLRLVPAVRRLYRDSVLGTDHQLPPAPNPFAEPAGFREWLLAPAIGGGTVAFCRFDYGIWRSRSDLRQAFPEPFDTQALAFREWLDHDPGAVEHYRTIGDARGVPRPSASAASPAEYGWSLIGYARAELGVGEAGRRLSRAVARTGVPWEMVGVTQNSLSRQEHRVWAAVQDRPRFINTLLCANADQTAVLTNRLGLQRHGGRRVGYWFWELEAFPPTYARAFELLDEVWVSGEFNRAAIAAVTDRPVRIVHLPIPIPAVQTCFRRRHFGLPEDKTLFLVNFDFLSVMARKNPLGAIAAYREAFGPDDGACLVVKSINGHLRPIDRERVRMAARGRADILMLDAYLTSTEVKALAELVDCVVSLHRSEGFGVNLADAMAVSTPVIATGYSGNLEFMTEDTSFLIPYGLVEVGPDAGPYDPSAVWADPDLSAAASAMRVVVDKPHLAQARAQRGLRHIAQFSAEDIAVEVAPLLKARYTGDPTIGVSA